MIDNDISLSKSVMYQTCNQNYFYFQCNYRIKHNYQHVYPILLSMCISLWLHKKERAELWAINHPEQMARNALSY